MGKTIDLDQVHQLIPLPQLTPGSEEIHYRVVFETKAGDAGATAEYYPGYGWFTSNLANR